jgi:hypothetical protein
LAAGATRTLLLVATAARATQIGQASHPPVGAARWRRQGKEISLRGGGGGGGGPRPGARGGGVGGGPGPPPRRRTSTWGDGSGLGGGDGANGVQSGGRSGRHWSCRAAERRWRMCGRARREALYTPSLTLTPRRRRRGGGSEAGVGGRRRERGERTTSSCCFCFCFSVTTDADEVRVLGGVDGGRPCAGSMHRPMRSGTPLARRGLTGPAVARVDRVQVRGCGASTSASLGSIDDGRRDGRTASARPLVLHGPWSARASWTGPVTSRVRERHRLFFYGPVERGELAGTEDSAQTRP